MNKQQIIEKDKRLAQIAATIADVLTTNTCEKVVFISELPSSEICDYVWRFMDGKTPTVPNFAIIQVEG
jgi:hypothetical protein